jgi:hypothetical protein
MKALGYLLGARAIDAAFLSERRSAPAEPPFLPIASTPDRAEAWRRWRAQGIAGDTGEPVSRARTAVPGTNRPARGHGAA